VVEEMGGRILGAASGARQRSKIGFRARSISSADGGEVRKSVAICRMALATISMAPCAAGADAVR
jgi:hypothetical protein